MISRQPAQMQPGPFPLFSFSSSLETGEMNAIRAFAKITPQPEINIAWSHHFGLQVPQTDLALSLDALEAGGTDPYGAVFNGSGFPYLRISTDRPQGQP